MTISLYQPNDEPDAELLRPAPPAGKPPSSDDTARAPRPPLTPADLAAADGALRCDLPCATCGYNLRTIPLTSRCPECATAVSVTLTLDRLYLHDPALLRRVAGGVFVAALGGSLLVLVLLLAVRPILRWYPVAYLGDEELALYLLAAAGLLVSLCGVWVMTTPNLAAPRVAPPADAPAGWTCRYAARASGGAAVALLIAAPLLAYVAPPDIHAAGLGLAITAALVAAVSGVSGLGYVESLMERVPGKPAALTAALTRHVLTWGVVALILARACDTLRSSHFELLWDIAEFVGPLSIRLGALALLAAPVLAAVAGWRAFAALQRTAQTAAELRASLRTPGGVTVENARVSNQPPGATP